MLENGDDSGGQIVSQDAVNTDDTDSHITPSSTVSVPCDDQTTTGDVPRFDKQNDKQSDKLASLDGKLTEVIDAWPGLSEAVKAGILALIRTSIGRGNG